MPDEQDAIEAAAAQPSEAAPGGFVLQLPVFEGPLDLLLTLLEDRQLDITEVSLLAVTEQYLAHLREAERLNLDAFADFIGIGARLLLLKSRALLPRDPEAEPSAAEDEADPEALLAALQEYRRFREAAEHLRELEAEGRTVFRRSAAPPEIPPTTGLDGTTLNSLMDVLREVLERLPPEKPIPRGLPRESVRLADRVRALVDLLDRDGSTSFRSLITSARTRLAVIVEFLAVLELVKARYLEARQSEAFGDIDLVKVLGGAPPSAEEIAQDFTGL
ncbi:MAG: segregation/condensation protein A [Dehalococcoidia bacterium]|nr:segregation/condensation protein A [Dehalococcoidia bacterium]HRC62203.1 ScpA family protein [Dehalococcoidia bacterium]